MGGLPAVPRRIAIARALADYAEYEREQEKSEVEKRILEKNPDLSAAELLELRDDYFTELGRARHYADQVIESIEPPEE